MITAVRNAILDFAQAARMRRVWLELATEDISDQHRRTFLGPIWLLVNYLLLVSAFIVVFAKDAHDINFSAYVATGMLVWLLLQEVATQSASLFIREEAFIKGTTLPLSTYVLRFGAQILIRTGYASLGWLFILAASGLPIESIGVSTILSMLLILCLIPAVIVVIAMSGAFFPDLQFILSNLMRVGMFLTPIFWTPSEDDHLRSMLYKWNPFTHFIEIVRQPLLAGTLPVHSIIVVLVIFASTWLLALFLLGKFRHDVVFIL